MIPNVYVLYVLKNRTHYPHFLTTEPAFQKKKTTGTQYKTTKKVGNNRELKPVANS